jgi:hypothetical protein
MDYLIKYDNALLFSLWNFNMLQFKALSIQVSCAGLMAVSLPLRDSVK